MMEELKEVAVSWMSFRNLDKDCGALLGVRQP